MSDYITNPNVEVLMLKGEKGDKGADGAFTANSIMTETVSGLKTSDKTVGGAINSLLTIVGNDTQGLTSVSQFVERATSVGNYHIFTVSTSTALTRILSNEKTSGSGILFGKLVEKSLHYALIVVGTGVLITGICNIETEALSSVRFVSLTTV